MLLSVALNDADAHAVWSVCSHHTAAAVLPEVKNMYMHEHIDIALQGCHVATKLASPQTHSTEAPVVEKASRTWTNVWRIRAEAVLEPTIH